MSLLEKQQKIVEQLKQGLFVEGMEEFYADNVVNEEPTGARIEGKQALIEHEKNVLAGVEAFHGVEVHSVGAHDDGNGNGVTFLEYSIRVDMKDGSKFNPDQVQVTTWENGLATNVRFYYNPNF